MSEPDPKTEPQPGGEPYRRFLSRLVQVRGQGVALGLDRIRLALERLGSPERALPAVHIAGTNGKGSCAALTDSMLRAGGLRVGLFTSPHLVRFTERIRIDGVEADGDYLAALDEEVAATQVPLTYFEIATVLAFLAFARAKVDVAVLETGLGGRLDATTACNPVACAITSIALDHQSILGSALSAIAFEKASIAKPGVPLFLAPLPPEALHTVLATAASIGAPVRQAGLDYPEAPQAPALAGAHQLSNAALATAIAEHAAAGLGRPLSRAAILRGLSDVSWPGRLERMAPDVLLDCAHNVEGAQALTRALPPSSRRALVTSIVRDKDAAGMLAAWAPSFDRLVLTRSKSERASDPERLAEMVAAAKRDRGAGDEAPPQVLVIDDPLTAFSHARAWAREASDGLVVAAGSIFLVGLLRSFLLGGPSGAVEASDPLP
jgi:dihydrofolate synthase / folylpolyglutamate synthase